MRAGLTSLLVGLTVLFAGCRSGEKRPDDRPYGPDRPADLSSRTKDPSVNPDTPAHWLDRPKPDWMKGSTPAARTWDDPISPKYDYKAETSGLLAGYVEDPDGRKMGGVYVGVREVGDTNPKEVGIVSLADGAFLIQGLKPNRNYMLSVNATSDGRKVFGVVYTKTPNSNVRIPLLEGELGGPPPNAKPTTDMTKEQKEQFDPLKRQPPAQPPSHAVPGPKAAFPNDGPLPNPEFGARPRSRGNLPTPQPLEKDAGVYPTGGYEVPPGTDPRPERNDLMTDRGPRPGQPPAANIPASPRREARKAESFPLVDAQGRGANLPQAKLVLVEFFTTASATCRRAVPTLNDVHKRYAGRGVEVVGLACDDEPLKARVMAADQFQSDLDVAYTLLTEPGKRPGEWMTRYGVAELPTAVLLDDTGAVLWQGNPAKADDLRAAIEAGLRGK